MSSRLPPEPKPFEYPASEVSGSPTPTPPPTEDVYKLDFFKDIAQYNTYYQDDQMLWRCDRWDTEVFEAMKKNQIEEGIGEEAEYEERVGEANPLQYIIIINNFFNLIFKT